jgi:hypothetical protein
MPCPAVPRLINYEIIIELPFPSFRSAGLLARSYPNLFRHTFVAAYERMLIRLGGFEETKGKIK